MKMPPLLNFNIAKESFLPYPPFLTPAFSNLSASFHWEVGKCIKTSRSIAGNETKSPKENSALEKPTSLYRDVCHIATMILNFINYKRKSNYIWCLIWSRQWISVGSLTHEIISKLCAFFFSREKIHSFHQVINSWI